MNRPSLRLPLVALVAFALLVPSAAVAAKKGKKKKRGKQPEPVEEPVQQEEKPAHMFKHVSTTDFFGDLKVERYVHDKNGLKVLLVPDASSETLAYHTYFDVGSSDEVEGKTGLAHLFEHMMFKRTDKYDDQHFSRVLEEAGTPDLNAWTWLDITAYHASLPKTKLDLIVGLESTRIDGLVIDQEQLDAEREVVRNERRFRVDNDPEGAMNERLWALAFEKNRYHWPTIGWDADIQGYSVEDCENFYKDYYAPNNATLVIAGGIDVEETLAKLEAAYGAIPPSDLKRLEHGDEPVQTELRRLDMEQQTQTELLQMGYKVPPMTHADYPALAVLDTLLTAGNSARLQRRLVDTGWASSASAFLPPFQHDALYEFSVTMREGKSADAALEIIRRELQDLKDRHIGDEELSRARNQLLSAQYGQLLSNSGRAGFLGFNEVAAGDWQHGVKWLDAIRAVTVEDVQKAAGTWLKDESLSVVVARPNGKDLLKFSAKKLPVVPTDESAELPPVIDRPLEGAPPNAAGELSERESMGWTRLMVYEPSVPMVWFRVVLKGGIAAEPAGKEGLANLTAELLLRGTQDRGRDVFERTLEGLGASVGAGVGNDSVVISGSTLAENWPKVASLLAEAFQFPAFDEDDFSDLVDEVKADIVDSRNSDRGLGRRAFASGLYGDHHYGRYALGTTKSLDSITRSDVVGFYRDHFTSKAATAALLGDFDAGASGDLAKIVGKLEGSAQPPASAPLPEGPVGRSLVLVDKPERSQVQIHLGHFFARPEGAEYAAAWVASEAFGGHGFGPRLMHEVREKRGWSYGAYGSISHRREASDYSIWVFPAIGDALPTLELVLSMYAELVADGIKDNELTYARSALVNSSAFYLDTPSKRLSYEVNKRTTGYDPMTLIPLIEELTLEQVNAAAATAFSPDNLLITVVGTADMKLPGEEAEEGSEDAAAGTEPKAAADESTLLEALQKLLGKDAVTVVPYDRE